MDSITLGTLVTAAGAVTAICAPILALQRIQKNIRKERDQEAAKILQEAKEEDALVKAKLESKIEALKQELRNFEASVDKDFQHVRETYNGEIRNLGQKIEELRTELRNQHGQLVQLLSEMIKSRD